MNYQATESQLRNKTVRDLMSDLAMKEQIKREAVAAKIKRQQELENFVIESELKQAELDYKAALESRDPLKIAQAEAAYANAARDRNAIKSPEEKAVALDADRALAEQRRAEAARARTGKASDELARAKFAADLEDTSINRMQKIVDLGATALPLEARKELANVENSRPGAGIVYVGGESVPESLFGVDWLWPDKTGEISAIKLPPKLAPYTGDYIMKKAAESKMTVQEYVNRFR